MQNQTPITIFVRPNKKKSLEKHPTHEVTIIANEDIPAGAKLYGGLWKKESDTGPFHAGNADWPIAQKQAQRAPPQQQRGGYGQRQAPSHGGGFDDEIPF